MLRRSTSKDGHHQEPPGPTYMSNKQMGQFYTRSNYREERTAYSMTPGDYLTHLRSDRVGRPQGSRPPPPSASPSRKSFGAEATSHSRGSLSSRSSRDGLGSRGSSVLSYYHDRPGSSLSGRSSPDKTCRSLSQQRDYRELEKQEARVIRSAMEEMDLEEEQRVVAAAQKEASELVWKHQNPGIPYPAPSAPTPSAHQQPHRVEMAASSRDPGDSDIAQGFEAGAANDLDLSQEETPKRSPSKRLAHSFSLSRLANRRRSGNHTRNVSGGKAKKPFPNSSERIFKDQVLQQSATEQNANRIDQREPVTQPSRNPFARAQSSRQNLRSSPERQKPLNRFFNRTEIQRNPPSQSRNPSYTRNPPPELSLQTSNEAENVAESTDSDAKFRNGMEVRSDEIRAATSMRMRDRSPKLPSPTIVSDEPGRPIVSFDPDWQPTASDRPKEEAWQPRDVRPREDHRPSSASPSVGPVKFSSAPVIPTIGSLPKLDEGGIRMAQPCLPPIPRINVPVPEINNPSYGPVETPTIMVESSSSKHEQNSPYSPARATPSIAEPDTTPTSEDSTPTPAYRPGRHLRSNDHCSTGQPAARPAPHHSATAPSTLPSKGPTLRAATALCAQCALPIQGRIVSAAGTRFHPGCFTCHHCRQHLECVEFYPEPGEKREERLQRIERRIGGKEVDPPAGTTFEDDNDDCLRFFCALDFHEFFSPRCKSCKTPIEGEVIVACGAEWHVGHFFCAQCGDVSFPRLLDFHYAKDGTDSHNSHSILQYRL